MSYFRLLLSAQIEGDVLASVILFAQPVNALAAEMVIGKVTTTTVTA